MALVSKEKIKKFFRHFFLAFVVSASVAQYSVANLTSWLYLGGGLVLFERGYSAESRTRAYLSSPTVKALPEQSQWQLSGQAMVRVQEAQVLQAVGGVVAFTSLMYILTTPNS